MGYMPAGKDFGDLDSRHRHPQGLPDTFLTATILLSQAGFALITSVLKSRSLMPVSRLRFAGILTIDS
jgi:hypothetical protein